MKKKEDSIVEKQLVTRRTSRPLPLFLPVYQPKSNLVSIEDIKNNFEVDGLIVNGFFLYKDAAVKKILTTEKTLHEYIGFDGIIMTDSGAFQALKRPLYLNNKKIVKFQDQIGADIVSPLDHISPPGDNLTTATKKLISTNKRIRQAKELVQNGILAGVQQGGKFMDLRKQSTEVLMEIGVEYLAIGSLVPFFNKRHDMRFVIKVLRATRAIAGEDIPMHVYGAGDPVELPFLAALGTDIFDSSSYGHYAVDDWYMTRFGALKLKEQEKIKSYNCSCKICAGNKEELIEQLSNTKNLAFHNLYTILDTIEIIRKKITEGILDEYLNEILVVHEQWFEDSLLAKSWREHYDV